MATPVVRWLQRRGLAVKQEFSFPWGICDLVGVKLDASRVKRRISYGQTRPIGPLLRLYILSRIPDSKSGRCVSLKMLRKEFAALPVGTLEKELDVLMRGKFVHSPKQGLLNKTNSWAPLHLRIVAVELKLSRVADAISQAVANHAAATHSYVALPGRLASHMVQHSGAEGFLQRGVGLLGVWPRSCVELVQPSTLGSSCDEIIQSHVVERFWRTRDN
jgi:hypothetical protein